jgi:hypothetical protein
MSIIDGAERMKIKKEKEKPKEKFGSKPSIKQAHT